MGGILIVVPARKGSKGVPRKNLKELGGKPLIQWTLDVLKDLPECRVAISTDCPEIQEFANSYGFAVPDLRPADLASDSAPAIDVLRYELDKIGSSCDYYVYLQPTSPFRSARDVIEGLKIISSAGCQSLVSVSAVVDHPDWMLRIDKATGKIKKLNAAVSIVRRQDLEPLFRPNGSIYIGTPEWIADENRKLLYDEDTAAMVMSKWRSIDLDDDLDFAFAEFLIENRRGLL